MHIEGLAECNSAAKASLPSLRDSGFELDAISSNVELVLFLFLETISEICFENTKGKGVYGSNTTLLFESESSGNPIRFFLK